MKLLFDQNLSFRLCTNLADLFPGSTHVRRVGLAEATDRDIWQFATENDYTIVSQDADFAEMGVLLTVPPKVIWLRTGNRPSTVIAALLRSHATLIQTFDSDAEAICLEIY